MNIPLSQCVPENLVSRDGFSRPVPRQPAHLHTQAESGAYLRDSSQVPRRRPFMKPPYAIGSVPSSSGHAIAYRWRSLPRVRRHRASKPQGISERVLPWQITMDQFIFASLSHTHTHYWYEVGMLKVPGRVDIDSHIKLPLNSRNGHFSTLSSSSNSSSFTPTRSETLLVEVTQSFFTNSSANVSGISSEYPSPVSVCSGNLHTISVRPGS